VALKASEITYLVFLRDHVGFHYLVELRLFWKIHPPVCQGFIAAVIAFEEQICLEIAIQSEVL
jgi:hypothetical protein